MWIACNDSPHTRRRLWGVDLMFGIWTNLPAVSVSLTPRHCCFLKVSFFDFLQAGVWHENCLAAFQGSENEAMGILFVDALVCWGQSPAFPSAVMHRIFCICIFLVFFLGCPTSAVFVSLYFLFIPTFPFCVWIWTLGSVLLHLPLRSCTKFSKRSKLVQLKPLEMNQSDILWRQHRDFSKFIDGISLLKIEKQLQRQNDGFFAWHIDFPGAALMFRKWQSFFFTTSITKLNWSSDVSQEPKSNLQMQRTQLYSNTGTHTLHWWDGKVH